MTLLLPSERLCNLFGRQLCLRVVAHYHPVVVGAKDPSRPGEEVVLDLRPHWWFFSRQALALVAAIVLGIFVLAFGPSILFLYQRKLRDYKKKE